MTRILDDAWPIAEKACKERLVVTDGDENSGMKRLGTERFHKWVERVERALESVNPKED